MMAAYGSLPLFRIGRFVPIAAVAFCSIGDV